MSPFFIRTDMLVCNKFSFALEGKHISCEMKKVAFIIR
jgi:hypothetical protein